MNSKRLACLALAVAFFMPTVGFGELQSAKTKKVLRNAQKEVVGDLEMPYDGPGEVTITDTGLVIVDAGEKGFAFYFNAPGQSILEDDFGNVTIGDVNATSMTIDTYDFVAHNPAIMRPKETVLDMEGPMILDYDGDDNTLSITVDMDDNTFYSVFSFASAVAQPDKNIIFGGKELAKCSCTLRVEGVLCSAATPCPDGYTCHCSCLHNKTTTLCKCSKCEKLSGLTGEPTS